MAEETRSPDGVQPKIDGPGPFLAKVKNHLDGEYMGSLEVELLKHNSEGNSVETTGQLITVSYLSPFYGVTPYKGVSDNDGNEFSQSSYGFWAVPPDIDTTVLVIFAEGNRGKGFWIGCVQDQYMNFMLPGYPSTTFNSEETGKMQPVVEYNKRTEEGSKNNPTQFLKPINKSQREALLRANLQDDVIRGHTSSSARRETPSMVFGMSTPGPADRNDGAPKVPYGDKTNQIQVPFNRLGGSSFVMDDGDPSLFRTSLPGVGPSAYASIADGGFPDLPANELVRIRTRTGHQILLHNSEDLIYIQHSNGTYIEFTSNGKIDVFANDSVNVHAKTDINLKADRNINIEAGSAINIKAGTDIKQDAGAEYSVIAGADGKLTFGGTSNITSKHHKETAGRIDMNSSGNVAATATAAPSPTRVPEAGGWTGSENRNPQAHIPEKTDNAEGTSSPKINAKDGTTAENTPEEAGEKPTDDTFKQCPPTGNENAGIDGPADVAAASNDLDAFGGPGADVNPTKDPNNAVVTNSPDNNFGFGTAQGGEFDTTNDNNGFGFATGGEFDITNPTKTRNPNQATITAPVDEFAGGNRGGEFNTTDRFGGNDQL